jgi:hypothetical protein
VRTIERPASGKIDSFGRVCPLTQRAAVLEQQRAARGAPAHHPLQYLLPVRDRHGEANAFQDSGVVQQDHRHHEAESLAIREALGPGRTGGRR